MSTLPVIGFVGTGKMGLPMTRNLLAAGYTVVAFNRSPESLAEAASAGATAATSLADVAAQADIILSSLTNQQSVRDVYLGNGERKQISFSVVSPINKVCAMFISAMVSASRYHSQ